MAQGDRVKIGDGSVWDDSIVVSVYQPRFDEKKQLIFDHYGAVQVQRLGGVKGGTTGTIHGGAIRVHRTQLFGEPHVPTIGGLDLVNMFPIQLDHYMQVGWIPAHHLRVIGGGAPPSPNQG